MIGYLLPGETAFYYSLSVVLAYVIGIGLSFLINQRFTFQQAGGNKSKFLVFVAIAITGLVSTWLLSLTLRYGLRLDSFLGDVAPACAFAAAALLSSALTYPLNALFVFREPRPG